MKKKERYKRTEERPFRSLLNNYGSEGKEKRLNYPQECDIINSPINKNLQVR